MSESQKSDGLIVIFVGPTGAGKDTLSAAAMKADPQNKRIVTVTTRQMRENEVDGVNYYFMGKDEFEQRLDNDEFLEFSRHYENYYGTLKKEIMGNLDDGYTPYTDITWSGASAIRDYRPKETVIFLLLPPSVEELNRRIEVRMQKTGESPEKLSARLEKIRTDLQHWQEKGYEFTNADMLGSRLKDYDYVIINDNLDDALYDIQCAIHAERLKRHVR